jgi:predicted lipoprotein with Yx(FWY)xxD motif
MKRPSLTIAWTAAAMLLATTASGCSSSSDNSSSSTSSASSTGATSASPGGGYGGSTSATASASAAQSTVSTRAVGRLGTILVDGKGRTLYLFKADTPDTSACSGTCAAAWPPLLTTGAAKAGQNIKSNLLGTSKRSGGATQVTYNHHPLYLYAGDAAAGDTNGQGLDQFGALWYVVNPQGNAVTG